MIGKGKKTREWEAARKKIVKAFFEAGITRCEVVNDPGTCWGLIQGFAHSKKRRDIQTEEHL